MLDIITTIMFFLMVANLASRLLVWKEPGTTVISPPAPCSLWVGLVQGASHRVSALEQRLS